MVISGNTPDVKGPAASSSQNLPLENLISDLSLMRARMLTSGRRRQSGVLAGQLLILAQIYQTGRRPSRHTLNRFFRLVSREAAA
jgi:hypothetical protein